MRRSTLTIGTFYSILHKVLTGVDSRKSVIQEKGRLKADARITRDRFDLIWTIEDPYTSINDPVTSEHVPGLDDAH